MIDRRFTKRELSEWLKKENGLCKIGEIKYNFLYYDEWEANYPVPDDILIRGWAEKEWHTPMIARYWEDISF